MPLSLPGFTGKYQLKIGNFQGATAVILTSAYPLCLKLLLSSFVSAQSLAAMLILSVDFTVSICIYNRQYCSIQFVFTPKYVLHSYPVLTQLPLST